MICSLVTTTRLPKGFVIHIYSYKMEQGLSEGSLRNSHRETHAVRRKPAQAKLQQRACALVESCSQDLVLRQRLDPDRVEVPLKKGTFYVLGNEGKADPGFLVFMKGEPAVFLQSRRGKNGSYVMASTFRLRVSAAMDNTVLIATLDDVLHSLRLEDVWSWQGECVTDKSYSQRRPMLKDFVENHWIPDARLLGGIYTSVAQPMTMEEFSLKKDWSQFHSIEIVPEQAGRRRMILYLEVQQKAAIGHAAEKTERGPMHVPARMQSAGATVSAGSAGTTISAGSAGTTVRTGTTDEMKVARAVPVDKMPDIYDLYTQDNAFMSRASVQQLALSIRLRECREPWVNVKWNGEFGGYEIIEILAIH